MGVADRLPLSYRHVDLRRELDTPFLRRKAIRRTAATPTLPKLLSSRVLAPEHQRGTAGYKLHVGVILPAMSRHRSTGDSANSRAKHHVTEEVAVLAKA